MVELDLRAPAERMYAGGEWLASTSLMPAENPADETVICQVAAADPQVLDETVRVAAAAAEDWGRRPWTERARLLRELAARIRADRERLALIDAVDSGNPWTGAVIDVDAAAATLEFMSGLAAEAGGTTIPSPPGVFAYTRRAPFGVVGRILAFNHPLRFAAQGAAAPLMAGNAVILKPADATALATLEFAALADGLLPPGVLNVLPGTGAQVGASLAAHPDVPRIGFTGSVENGRAVMAAGVEHIKTVTLELGGKNALIVCPDADVSRAAEAAVRGMNIRTSNGQSCQSTSRILVHESVHDAFVEALVDVVRALKVGRPEDPATDVGPLIHGVHRERVAGFVARARDEGARLRCGGERPAGLDRGHFIEPAVFDRVTPDMELAREEVFGPVIAVMPWADPAEAVRLANGTRLGLTANIWTNDLATAHRFVERMHAGLVWVNGPAPRPPGTPFGGWKHSGLGKEQCLEELLSYTREMSVVTSYPDDWEST